MRFVPQYQRASLHAARDARVDGIVCGHIHKPDLIERDGLAYYNDGDWVESCTALVEDESGELSLLAWRPAATVISGVEVAARKAA